jgi:hypothetical protein
VLTPVALVMNFAMLGGGHFVRRLGPRGFQNRRIGDNSTNR